MKPTFQLTALATALMVSYAAMGQTSALERFKQSRTQFGATSTTGTSSSGSSVASTGSNSVTTTAGGATASGSTTSGSQTTTTDTSTGAGGTSATAGTTTTGTSGTAALSAGQMRVATRVAAPFATVAGSPENALALAASLRTGTPATITSTSTDASGATVTTSTSITPPTKPMGWGNVSHALALATTALSNAGVTNPTTADVQAALLGGNVTTPDGKTVALTGVLQQRADGMGWGAIAKSYGTTMGAVNRTLHTPTVSTNATTAPIAANSTNATKSVGTGIVSGDGASHGVTTAASTSTSHGKSALSPGLTTGSGTSAPSGVVNAAGSGSGNAYGRGIVTASGSTPGSSGLHKGGANGIVTASGNSGSVAKSHDNSGNGKGKNGG